MSNALKDARSPFLQHGAHQPVDWNPWGDEAFEKAKRENKPILLDIGAVWCHWCHVMDRESYDDFDTAQVINELFVPVKVDRDERPDVDARYQRAVQSLSGEGGWPLTAFLTPEGEVFYGGTYYPPEDRYGRPSFQRVMREVSRLWTQDQSRVAQAVDAIRGRLRTYSAQEAQIGNVSAQLVEAAADEFAHNFDFRYGGFGRAPKFPHPSGLLMLTDFAVDTGHEWALRIVVETLYAMGRGGINDQLGGGFHRYATDARWLIPHFEKMAYDNGPLLDVVARAYAVTQDEYFRTICERIVSYYRDVSPELVEAGGFPSSQDADIDASDDGDYWTWSRIEIADALEDSELEALAVRHFGIEDPGSAMHSNPLRHVLYRAEEPNGRAEKEKLERIYKRLKDIRDKRPRPYVDETLYSSFVSLVAAGHLAAGRYAGVSGAASAALRALERIWAEAWVEEKGIVHRVGDPDSAILLDDQVFTAEAMLDAHELTQHEKWLERAGLIMTTVLDRFREAEGTLRDTPASAEPVRPITDSPTPSGNGVGARVMLRLYALTHSREWLGSADAILRAFAGTAARMPTATATFVHAVAWRELPVTTIVIVGNDDETEEMLGVALSRYIPRSVVRRLDSASLDTGSLPEEMRAMVTGEAPRAYVCKGSTCHAPVATADELGELLTY